MKSVKLLVPVFIVFASFFTTATHAQQQKRTYYPHEELELQDGLKVEILRSRGEGDNEELDVIYYTTTRQLGKRMWERADVIREKEQTAIDERRAKEHAAIAPASTAKKQTVTPSVTDVPVATASTHKIDSAETTAPEKPVIEKTPETRAVTKQKSSSKKNKAVAKNVTTGADIKTGATNNDSLVTEANSAIEATTVKDDVVASEPAAKAPVVTKQKLKGKKEKLILKDTSSLGNGVKPADALVSKPDAVVKTEMTNGEVNTSTPQTKVPVVTKQKLKAKKEKTVIKGISPAYTYPTTAFRGIPPTTTYATTDTSLDVNKENNVTSNVNTQPATPVTAQPPVSSNTAANKETTTTTTEKQIDVNANSETTVAPVNDAPGINVGSKVEANAGAGWKPASVVETEGDLLYRVHFDGETSDDDEWIAATQVRKAKPLVAPVTSTKGDKSAASKALRAADKSAAQNCTFKAPVAPVAESEQFSINLAKRKIYDAYVSNMKKATTPASKYGMTFISLNTLEPFINTFTMLSSGTTQYKYPEAPPGAYIYTLRSKHVICEQYPEGVKRTLVEANYGCFRNRDGSWACRVIGSPDEKEID
jgi:hypothetical protein